MTFQPLIFLGWMRLPRRSSDEAFWEVGMPPQVRVEGHSVSSAYARAARDIGSALINELTVRDFAHLTIQITPLRERLLHRFAFGVTGGAALARRFIDTLSDRFRNLLAEDQSLR